MIEPINPALVSEEPAQYSITTTQITSSHDAQPTTSICDNLSSTDVTITPSIPVVQSTSSAAQLALILPEHIQKPLYQN